MQKNKPYYLLLLMFISISIAMQPALAQDDQDDSNDIDDEEEFFDEVEGMDWTSFDEPSFEKPFIELVGGTATLNIHEDEFKGKSNDLMGGELRLGFYEFDTSSTGILKYENYYLLGNMFDTEWASSISDEKYKMNTYQFGIGWTEGDCYSFGPASSIVFYTASEMIWNKLDFESVDYTNTMDAKYIKYIGNSVRYGQNYISGIKIIAYSPISIDVNYARNIIHPRFMIWDYIGSGIVQGIMEGALGFFTDEIEEVSPGLAPVVNFVLRSALQYGVTELLRGDMNWPIQSDKPLVFDKLQLGFSIHF